MSWNRKETRAKLKSMGLRATVSRVAVLQYFSSTTRPISHTVLVNEMAEDYGDQATLFRTLKTFTDIGLLRVASKAEGITRYELAPENDEPQHVHPHFVCNKCGVVSCLPETTVITKMEEEWKEIIKAAELQFIGQCLSCKTA
jgi:Fur family transcriptional regulator, ferric uptake regulator